MKKLTHSESEIVKSVNELDAYNNESPHDSLNNLAPMEYRLMRTG